jgi:hypothetical protein
MTLSYLAIQHNAEQSLMQPINISIVIVRDGLSSVKSELYPV